MHRITTLLCILPILGFLASSAWCQTLNWSQANPVTTPPGRFDHKMVSDVARGEIVMFGGFRGPPYVKTLADTWTWDGSKWTLRKPITSPPGLSNYAMAYDVVRKQVVLLGGRTKVGQPINDVDGVRRTRRPAERVAGAGGGRQGLLGGYRAGADAASMSSATLMN